MFLGIGIYLLSARPANEFAFELPAIAPSSSELAASEVEQLVVPHSDIQPSQVPPPPQVDAQTYTVQRGDTLAKIWTKAGAAYASAIAAERALKALDKEALTIRPGDELRLFVNDDSGTAAITRMERELKGGKLLILESTNGTEYAARYEELPTTAVERTVSGSVTSSISHAAVNLGVPYDVIDDVVDLFGARVSFHRSMQPGDTFTLVYEELVAADGEVLVVKPLKMASLGMQGALLAAVRHEGTDGNAYYFDERGEQLGSYFLRYPVNFSRISSVFSKARFHPVLQRHKPHRGVDFAAPVGTPVRAVSDGVVVRAGYNGGAGNMVTIRHCDRYTTQYMHLSKISAGLRAGTRVSRGQVIGAVGSTGLATGPHLHFELFDRGTYVDPLGAQLPRLVVNSQQIPQTVLAQALNALKREHQSVVLAAEKSETGKAAA